MLPNPVQIPVYIINEYSNPGETLTLYSNTYYISKQLTPSLSTFTEDVTSSGINGPPSQTTIYSYNNSEMYIFYYDPMTGNTGLFQSIKISNVSSLTIALRKICKFSPGPTVIAPNVKYARVQIQYISNNIDNYVKSSGSYTGKYSISSRTKGCWWYGYPNNAICVDTDQLQEDINSGLVGCDG